MAHGMEEQMDVEGDIFAERMRALINANVSQSIRENEGGVQLRNLANSNLRFRWWEVMEMFMKLDKEDQKKFMTSVMLTAEEDVAKNTINHYKRKEKPSQRGMSCSIIHLHHQQSWFARFNVRHQVFSLRHQLQRKIHHSRRIWMRR